MHESINDIDILIYCQLLHNFKVIHGDLAARNVLVGRQGLCKLTGIGEQPLVFDKDTYATRKKVSVRKNINTSNTHLYQSW